MVLSLSACAPAAAAASSLLSGYGGPGQGNQAILGSVLLNGPGAGQGGGSAGAPSSSAGGPQAANSGGAGARHSSSNGRGGGPATHAAGSASGAGSQSYSSTPLPSLASETVATGAQTLGLSGADLLYILLTLGALVFTGALTRQLTRQPR
jgi:hypothetical protein